MGAGQAFVWGFAGIRSLGADRLRLHVALVELSVPLLLAYIFFSPFVQIDRSLIIALNKPLACYKTDRTYQYVQDFSQKHIHHTEQRGLIFQAHGLRLFIGQVMDDHVKLIL